MSHASPHPTSTAQTSPSTNPPLSRRRQERTASGQAGPFPGSAVRTSAAVLLAVLLFVASPMLSAGAAAPHRSKAVAAEIDRFLSAAMKTSAIPGAAVAVTRRDQVLMVRGYGRDSTGEAVTGDSLFRIASLSKSFTALAVMQLVETGRLELDDPVHDHLPEFQLTDPRSDQITVRQLLDHTSGLSDAVVPELSRPQPRTSTEATSSLRSARLASTPGTSYSYHNPNYQVAARLVEVVSGEPFDRYLRRHILQPAGMAASSSTATDDEPVPGLTEGHVIAYGHAVPAPGMGGFTVGEGGIVSSAADMARWLIVHANEGQAAAGTRLVSRSGLRVLHTASAPEAGYALGWATHGPTDAPTRLEHSGNLLTFTSEAALWPASGYGVVLLFNAGSPMMLDQTAIVHGVFDIIEGNAPSSGPGLAATLDTVLAVATLAALTLGALGVVRAGPWARRRHRTRPRAALGLIPAVAVLGAGAAFPRVAEAWIERDVTWRAGAYGWPALVVFVLAALLAATATLLARAWQWRRIDGAHPRPDHSARNAHPGSAGPDPGHLTGASHPVTVQARQK
ncbi:MAG TPA: serine hydrolase domain-containing protein [Propionibacteriaceae bacterium]|nr:serine hydrolase domain-containing protein [Propionibacteriaceae bacterium]